MEKVDCTRRARHQAFLLRAILTRMKLLSCNPVHNFLWFLKKKLNQVHV